MQLSAADAIDGSALPSTAAGRRKLRLHHRLLIAVVILVAMLVALRVALPYWVKDAINQKMASLGDYRGHVEDVNLHLWRGAYSLDGMLIEKSSGKVPVPLLKAPRVDLSVSWRELFHGGVVAEVVFEHPELNLVDGRSQADTQNGRGVDWRKQLDRLLPIKLNDVRVKGGTVAFRAFDSKPTVDLKATNVEATILNLTNVRGAEGKRVAVLDAHADVIDGATLETHASFDPFGTLDDFTFNLHVVNVELKQLNPLLQAYADLDVASGRGEFVMELEARDGQLNGYAKPLLRGLQVMSWKKDARDNPFHLAWEALAGGAAWIFSNQRADQFATRIPISGSLKNPKAGKVDALLSTLRNAFVEALKPQFEKIK